MFPCNSVTNVQQTLPLWSCERPARIRRIDHYAYYQDNPLGQGSYSIVYQGYDLMSEELVAVKVIEVEEIRKKNLAGLLYQESRIVKELDHPSVIKCLSFLKSDQRHYIVTELCQKQNLRTLLAQQQHGRLPPAKTQKIIFEIFQGLLYLAQKAVIHRDLKTENILFGKDGRAKIADFGFAIYGLSEFKDNFLVGTPLYMSPETILQQKYGPKTDIWAFGLLIYEMYFGASPFVDCNNQAELTNKKLKQIQIPSSISSIDGSVVEILHGCLEPNALNRWNIQKLAESDYMSRLKSTYGNMASGNKKQERNQEWTGSPLAKKYTSPNNFRQTNSWLVASRQIQSPLRRQKINLSRTQLPPQHQESDIQRHPNRSDMLFFKTKASRTTEDETVDENSQNIDELERNQKCKSTFLSPTIVSRRGQFKMLKKTTLPPELMTTRPSGTDSYTTDIKDLTKVKTHMEKISAAKLSSRQASWFKNRRISYTEVLQVLNYCRLLYRFLKSAKKVNSKMNKWAVTLIYDMKQNAIIDSSKKEQIGYLQKLLNTYYQKYSAELGVSKSGDQTKSHDFMDISEVLQWFAVLIGGNSWSESQKETLFLLLNETKILIDTLKNTCSFAYFAAKSKAEKQLAKMASNTSQKVLADCLKKSHY